MITVTSTPDPADIPWLGKNLRSTYWGASISDEDIAAALKNSLHFWAFDYEGESAKPVGFARALSDGVIATTIMDFFVVPTYQGQGVGKKLIEYMLAHESIKRTAVILATRDASSFYEKFGFKLNMDPVMIRYRP